MFWSFLEADRYFWGPSDKKEWIAQERNRWAKAFNVPMKTTVPEGFPPLTLTVMRAFCALTVVDGSQDVLIKVLDELLKDMWVDHRKVWEKEICGEVFGEVLGEERAAKGMYFSYPFCSICSWGK